MKKYLIIVLVLIAGMAFAQGLPSPVQTGIINSQTTSQDSLDAANVKIETGLDNTAILQTTADACSTATAVTLPATIQAARVSDSTDIDALPTATDIDNISAQITVVEIIADTLLLNGFRRITIEDLAVTAAVDSLVAFTAVGDIIIHNLSWKVATQFNSATDSIWFTVRGTPAIADLDEGIEANGALVDANTVFVVASATSGTSTTVILPGAFGSAPDIELFIPDGAEILLRSAGAGTEGRMTASATYTAFSAGARLE